MNSKRLLCCILCIIMCVMLLVPEVYAGRLGAGATGEYGDRRPQPRPDAPSNPGPTPEVTVDAYADQYIYVPHYIYIKGEALENPGYQSETVDDNAIMNPVPGVKFSAGDASAITGEDGSYSLYPSPGEYDLEIKYGDITEAGGADVSDVLKYNGYDYMVSKAPSDDVYDASINIIREEIISSKKGAAQVFILLDCSYSMRTTYVMVDGVRKTRVQNAVDSSKVLISELLDGANNVYIGIVAFAGNCFRAASLSKDKDFLYETLDSLPILPENAWAGGTNIVYAFEKAMESFYYDESNPNYKDEVNRNIVLVSDGIPTADKTNRLYADDDEDFAETLLRNEIGPNTREEVVSCMEEGVNVMTLITESEYEEEKTFVESIYQDVVTYYRTVKNEQELAEAIKKDIKEWIEDHIEEITEYTPIERHIRGKEDEDRRELVDSYFNQKPFYYDVEDNSEAISMRTSLFKTALEDGSGVNEDTLELSDKTYMTAHSGPYHIDEPREETLVETVTVEDEDGVSHTYHIYTIHYNTGYDGQDLHLMRRQEFKLQTEVTTTGVRVTLNTGEILNEDTCEFGTDVPLVEWIDDDIALGATVEIEYTIRIKNDSSLQINELELIDYLPEDFYFNRDSKLITEHNVTNNDLGWMAYTVGDIHDNGYVDEVSYDKYNRKDIPNAVKLIRDNAGKGANGFFVPAAGTFEVKIVASRVFSNGADFGGSNIFDACEVLGYDNNADRRVAYTLLDGDTVLHSMYPGDTVDIDYSISSNGTIISPPTGPLANRVRETHQMISDMREIMKNLAR